MEKPKFDVLMQTLSEKLNEGIDKLKTLPAESTEYGICLKNIASTMGAIGQLMPRPDMGRGEEQVDAAPKNENQT